MGKRVKLYNNFSSGEISPALDARSDKSFYGQGCRVLEGCLPIMEGGVARVPGTRFLRSVKQLEEGWGLRVIITGDGSGTVVGMVDGSPEGIDCGIKCYVFYVAGVDVTLVATPGENSEFVGWSGDGVNSGDDRVVHMDGNKTVYAEFKEIIIPTYMYQAEKWQPGVYTEILSKRVYSDLSEAGTYALSNGGHPGVVVSGDIASGDGYYIIAAPHYTAVAPAHSDVMVAKVWPDLTQAWKTTIVNPGSPTPYTPRSNTRLAVDAGLGYGYASLGYRGSYDGNAFIIMRFSVASGSGEGGWFVHALANSGIADLCTPGGGLVCYIGHYHGGYADQNIRMAATFGSTNFWAINMFPTNVNGVGQAIGCDSSGIYGVARIAASPYTWYYKRVGFDGFVEWTVTQDHSTIVPRRVVVPDGLFFYVAGGAGAEYFIEKRYKSDGALAYNRTWGSGGLGTLSACTPPIDGRMDVGGDIYTQLYSRNENLLESNFSTVAYVNKNGDNKRRGVDGIVYDA